VREEIPGETANWAPEVTSDFKAQLDLRVPVAQRDLADHKEPMAKWANLVTLAGPVPAAMPVHPESRVLRVRSGPLAKKETWDRLGQRALTGLKETQAWTEKMDLLVNQDELACREKTESQESRVRTARKVLWDLTVYAVRSDPEVWLVLLGARVPKETLGHKDRAAIRECVAILVPMDQWGLEDSVAPRANLVPRVQWDHAVAAA